MRQIRHTATRPGNAPRKRDRFRRYAVASLIAFACLLPLAGAPAGLATLAALVGLVLMVWRG